MRLKPNHIALLLLALFAFNAIQYARAMPPFEAADEAAHFLYSHNLLQTAELPVIVPREDLSGGPTQVWAIESHQPPLYYALVAALISPTVRDDIDAYLQHNRVIFTLDTVANNPNKWLHSPVHPGGDTLIALWLARSLSIALALGTLWLIYQAARQVTRSNALALLALLIASSIPTFVSISASVNNDNLVTLLTTLGVYLLLRIWAAGRVEQGPMLALALALPAALLAKLTGAALIALVFGALLAGLLTGHLPRRDVLRALGTWTLSIALLAGWWFIRNLDLYGDPLALEATQALWGREFEIAATSGDPLAEAGRIWRSFWMMMGHLHWPVIGPTWVFIYAGLLTALGIAGAGLVVRRLWREGQRDRLGELALLAALCGLLLLQLIAGTQSVDISYGRLLFPMLIGFAPLLALGWHRLAGRAGAVALALPLVFATLWGWVAVLPTAYAPLQPVDALPDDAAFIGVQVDGLSLLAYTMAPRQVGPEDTITLDLYLKGQAPSNPALQLAALDAVTLERLGDVQLYPGMAPMDALDPAQIYRARIRLPLDMPDGPARSPRQIRLQVRWFSPSLFEPIPLVDDSGGALDSVLLRGPLLLDASYRPPDPRFETDLRYGDAVVLEGYSLEPVLLGAGAESEVTLHWRVRAGLPDDWTLTVQLFGPDGRLAAQADGPIAGYPATAWRTGTRFTEARTLSLPPDAPPGTYRLLVGWYRVTDAGFVRLPVTQAPSVIDDLAVLAQGITVE